MRTSTNEETLSLRKKAWEASCGISTSPSASQAHEAQDIPSFAQDKPQITAPLKKSA